MVDISKDFQLTNASVQIHVAEIHIFHVQQVNQFEIGSIRHFVGDTIESLWHAGHGEY